MENPQPVIIPISRPSVGIVVLAYDRYLTTKNCIVSLQKIDYPSYTIIIVDNNSPDYAGKKLKAEFPTIHLIENNTNLGFCGGNNVGIAYCLKNKFDYILLLNDDVEVEATFLTVMIDNARLFRDKPHVMAGKIFCHHDRNIVWYAGGRLSYLHGAGKHFGHFRKDDPRYDIAQQVDYCTGCLMLVKSEAFKIAGLLKESIFAYLDDVEFCMRLKKAHIGIYYTPQAIIYHHVGAGTDFCHYSPSYFYYSTRNRILLSNNVWYQGYLLMYTWVISLMKIKLLFLRNCKKERGEKVGAILRGCRDAAKIYFKRFLANASGL